MRENNSIQIRDGERKLAVLVGRFVPTALKHPAIKSDGAAIHVKKMTRASNFTCSTDKRYLQTAILLLPHRAETESLIAARPVTSAPAPTLLYFSRSGGQ